MFFKFAATSKEACQDIVDRIVREDPSKWPYGCDLAGFNGGLYLIREKSASIPVGFAGWQTRNELSGGNFQKVGYYSIGILPHYRQNGFAKEAVAKLLAIKAAGVDCVRALVVEGNRPSLSLAASLGVPVLLKKA